VIKFWFPSQFVVSQLELILKRSYGVDLEIEHATIDPYAKMEFQEIVLYSSTDRQPVLQIESASAGYDLLSLITHRELRINYVRIDAPRLFLAQTASGSWNIQDVIDTLIQKANLAPSSDSLMEFPVKIALEKLDVEDFALSFQANSESLKVEGSVVGINVRIRDLSGTSMLDLHGNAAVGMPDGRIAVRVEYPVEVSLEARLIADCDVRLDSSHLFVDFDADLKPDSFSTSVAEWQPASLPNLSISLKSVIDQRKKRAVLDPVVLSVDPIRLECQAEAVFDSTVEWSFATSPVTLQLKTLYHMITGLKLPALAQLEQLPALAGTLSLDSLIVTGSGTMPEMSDLKVIIGGGISAEIPTINGIEVLPVSTEGFESSVSFKAVVSGADLVDGMAQITGGIKCIVADSSTASLALDSVLWDVQISLLDAGKSLQVQAGAGIGRVLDGSVGMTAAASINVPSLLEQKPEALEKLVIEASLQHLDAGLLGNGAWGGGVSAEMRVAANGTGRFDGGGSVTIASPWIVVQQERLAFPDVHQSITVSGLTDLSAPSLDVSKIDWSWEDLASAEFAMHVQPPEFGVQILSSRADIARLREFLPLANMTQINITALSGTIACTGRVEGTLNDMARLSYQFSPSIEQAAIRMSEPRASISNLEAHAEISGDLEAVAGSAELTIGNGGLDEILPDLLQSTKLTAGFHMLLPNEFRLDSFGVEMPTLAILGKGNAQFDLAGSPPSGGLTFDVSFGSPRGITLLDTIICTGVTRARGSLRIDTSAAMIDAEMLWSDVGLSIGTMVRVKGLSGRIPITQGIELTSMSAISQRPSSMAHRALGMPSYCFLQPSYHTTMPSFGTVTIDSIIVMGYGVSDLSMDATVANGYVEVPSIACHAYGGSIRGDLWAEINGLNPDSVRFGVQMQAAGIQTSQLVAKSEQNPEESVICADAHLTIDGIPASPNFDMEGNIDITRIGRGVAVDLLQIMDPEGKDDGIQSTKQYLQQGWGVKVFSFAVRDGFVYSYIVPSAPPPSRLHMYLASKIVRLPPQIAYGRIPLKFLLQMQAVGG